MRRLKFVSAFVLLALLLSAGPGTVVGQDPPPPDVQQSPPIPIHVDGQTIMLELGKNVHPQTYALLRDPDFASQVDWTFMDGLWVPLSRGVEMPLDESLPEGTPPPAPLYVSECRISLNVPAYSQRDQSWRRECLFGFANCQCGTMYWQGCAITSATMVFKYFGASKDPGQVNSCSGSYRCYADCPGTPEYDPCCLVWRCASSHCSDNEAGYAGYYSFHWEALCGLLSADRPPIVELRKGNSTHFVVVRASRGHDFYDPRDYTINDPLDGSTYKTLAAYTGAGWNPYRIAEYYNR